MRAWRLAGPGGAFALEEVPSPAVRPGSVLVRMEAAPLLTYLGAFVAGTLPAGIYRYPEGPFTPGTNGVGTVQVVGAEVWHLRPGQRVLLSPFLTAAENVEEPAQILTGLTAISPDSGAMLAAWPDGTLAEEALAPAAALTPIEGSAAGLPAERLASLGKFVVPLGGLLRGRLEAGETLVVSGATGYFGSAAVLLGLAMGAARVIALGRNRAVLDELKALGGERLATLALSGDAAVDALAIRTAAGGGAHLAFDMPGRAGDANATLAALRGLRRGGRLVLMGSMGVPLPLPYGEVMRNDWQILGNFMYRPEAFRRLLALVGAGLLDLEAVRTQTFPLAELPSAMEAAAKVKGPGCVVSLCRT